ncbi:hypothetical protein AC792_12165 [Arthrobacter sp. RIT-PI-e]|nr:hypothetical protein AC792_12165 [Arthrobacter sp. RIT-PI-e]
MVTSAELLGTPGRADSYPSQIRVPMLPCRPEVDPGSAEDLVRLVPPEHLLVQLGDVVAYPVLDERRRVAVDPAQPHDAVGALADGQSEPPWTASSARTCARDSIRSRSGARCEPAGMDRRLGALHHLVVERDGDAADLFGHPVLPMV